MNARPHPGPLSQKRESPKPHPASPLALRFTSHPSASTPRTAIAPTIATSPSTAASPSLSAGERDGVKASFKTHIEFAVATQDDDSAIRRLLRDNPMPGTISLSLEREPHYFADANQPGETRQTIIARHSNRVVCVGNCTTRFRFVNGQPRRVGYLGGLRLDASVTGRFDILRRGYAFFRELQASNPADYYFTSIAVDNHRARSFLERNLLGMPRYEFLAEFVTLLLPSERRLPVPLTLIGNATRTEKNASAHQLASLLNDANQHLQLAPHWTTEQLASLRHLGLRERDWSGETALWDQRCFKQTVIRGYTPWLALLRPAINFSASLANNPGLPAIGSSLSHAYALLGALPIDLNLVQHLRSIASERHIDWLTLGFAINDPRLKIVRQHFRCREYHSRLYLVRWPGLGGFGADLDQRILAPEVALL